MKKNIYISASQSRYERLKGKTVNFIRSASSSRYINVLAVLTLMAATPLFAQNQNEKEKKETIALQTISGVVLSAEDSSTLEGANIILKGTGVGTIADKQGRFVFPQQLKEGDVLLFSFVGTQTLEYKVPAHAEVSLVIKMKMGFDLTGDLTMDEIYTRPSRKR